MSKYYKVNELKVRVSDHEPNFSMDKFRGCNDIELYVKDIEGNLLSVETQLNVICEKRGYDVDDFKKIFEDWKDGSYNKDIFTPKKEEDPEYCAISSLGVLDVHKAKMDKLEGFSRLKKDATREEIKALSEASGVSQNFIKTYFREI